MLGAGSFSNMMLLTLEHVKKFDVNPQKEIRQYKNIIYTLIISNADSQQLITINKFVNIYCELNVIES